MPVCLPVQHILFDLSPPSSIDKFVGGSEQKIRDLFADAEKEQLEMGDNSMLHIIIFDEMDAIMKSRGSTNVSSPQL